MPTHDNLGCRMKTYEAVSDIKLIRRMPVIIRIDGKAFHTFTKNFKKPFDDILIEAMQNTTKYLCENIQGCVFGYTQSDEISLVLIDYQTLETDAWFDYRVQKICSVAASAAAMAFNRYFKDLIFSYFLLGKLTTEEVSKYSIAFQKGAIFDARCFNIPKEEVTNCIYWRQLDATRNSIQMVGQANFSHKELQNKSCNEIQEMLHEQKNINWDDFPAYLKRGTAVVQKPDEENPGRNKWFIDLDMPQLKGADRAYLDDLIYIGE